MFVRRGWLSNAGVVIHRRCAGGAGTVVSVAVARGGRQGSASSSSSDDAVWGQGWSPLSSEDGTGEVAGVIVNVGLAGVVVVVVGTGCGSSLAEVVENGMNRNRTRLAGDFATRAQVQTDANTLPASLITSAWFVHSNHHLHSAATTGTTDDDAKGSATSMTTMTTGTITINSMVPPMTPA